MTAPIRFDRFELDPADRQLRRDGNPLDLNNRYLDALALLAANPGRLVTKDRFLEEVWRGVPVTDEALTQCIRSLRKLLGDDAARPRFIETVPKHGYRFVALIEGTAPVPVARAPRWERALLLAAAGTLGGGLAGTIGGIVYGLTAASAPLPGSAGALSVLLVLLCITVFAAAIGAAGVSGGIAAAGLLRRPGLVPTILGGALGGMAMGALVKLLGLDAFTLLVGRSPGDITGGAEGAFLGAGVGLGAWLVSANPDRKLRFGVILAAATGAAGALAAVAFGGRLMAGSLSLLASAFPDSRLRLDQIGLWLGEPRFGLVSSYVTAALEGALFAACVVAAIGLAHRRLAARDAQIAV